MADRVEFMGPQGQVGTPIEAAQVSVESGHEWLYAEVVKGVLQVWTGTPCQHCVLTGEELQRCPFHARTLLVARQLAWL